MAPSWLVCCVMSVFGYSAAAYLTVPDEEYTCTQGCVATTAITCYRWQSNAWLETSNDEIIEYDENDGGPWEVNGACHCNPQCGQDAGATNQGSCKVGAKIKFKVTVSSYKKIEGGSTPLPSASGQCQSLTQGSSIEVKKEACGTDITVWILAYSAADCATSSANKYLIKVQLRCTDCNGTCPTEPV